MTTAEGAWRSLPLKVVKAVLPDPSSLAPNYTGKDLHRRPQVKGQKDGKEREIFIYNVADHAEAYAEVGSQAISYTAGVPPVAAAMLIAEGTWDPRTMVNVEELDPPPLSGRPSNRIGLPTRIKEGRQGRGRFTFAG